MGHSGCPTCGSHDTPINVRPSTMSPVTHFLMGWLVANTANLDRRERAAVTMAGVKPDIDGIGTMAETLTRGWDHPLAWYSGYHRVLAHNLGAALLVATASFLVAPRRWSEGHVWAPLSFSGAGGPSPWGAPHRSAANPVPRSSESAFPLAYEPTKEVFLVSDRRRSSVARPTLAAGAPLIR